MNIKDLVREAYDTAVDKGWWDEDRPVPEAIALMHSELSEALEEYRTGHAPNHTYYFAGKPEGIPIELADVIIRIADFCGRHSIDLEQALVEKMAYNKSRSKRHGGKVC